MLKLYLCELYDLLKHANDVYIVDTGSMFNGERINRVMTMPAPNMDRSRSGLARLTKDEVMHLLLIGRLTTYDTHDDVVVVNHPNIV